MRDVLPSLVTNWTKEPLAGRSVAEVAHFKRISDTKSRLVQVEVSALGIHLRFIGVSKVIGNKAKAVAFSGSPDFSLPRLFVNWCTAAFAIP